MFLYATGIRLGEFCRLKRAHIRWDQGYFEIERNKQNKPLLIALTPAIAQIIRTAQALDQSEYVFSRDGQPTINFLGNIQVYIGGNRTYQGLRNAS